MNNGSEVSAAFESTRLPTTISAIYFAAAIVWIFLTDTSFQWFGYDPNQFVWISLGKGALFVAVTTGLLYVVLKRYIGRVQRVQAEREESEQRFRQLAENINSHFWIVDAGYDRFLYRNPAMDQFWGEFFNGAEDLRSRFLEAVHPEDRNRIRRKLPDQKSDFYEATFRVIKPGTEDEVYWFHVRSFPVRNEENDVYRIVGISDDITARKNRQRELEAQREALEQSLEEKTTLLKEVHHRVRNNLQTIVSLLSLSSRTTDNPAVIETLQQSKNRIHSISLVHKLLYQSENLSDVQPKEYVEELTEILISDFNRSNRVRAEFDVDKDIGLDLDTMMTTGLILNELITNCLEHGFPEDSKGTLSVRLLKTGDRCELMVEDDGPGFPEDVLEHSPDSLGLTLVRNLTENQLNGSLELSSSNGARVLIRFPV